MPRCWQVATIDEPYVDVASTMLRVANAPDEVLGVTLRYTLSTSHGVLMRAVIDPLPFGGGSGSTVLPIPAGSFDVVIDGTLATEPSHHAFSVWGPAAPEHLVNIGAIMLAGFPERPAWDGGSAIVWTGSDGAGASAVQLSLNAMRGETFWSHTIVAPYTTGRVELPTLPIEDFDWNLDTAELVFVPAIGALSTTGGYDAVRANMMNRPLSAVAVHGPAGESATVRFP